MTVQTMSSEQARTQWRTLLDLASRGNVDVVIERHGKATATLIGYERYQALAEAEGAGQSQRGQRMADALAELAALPETSSIDDPLLWQIEQRAERPLAGRDG